MNTVNVLFNPILHDINSWYLSSDEFSSDEYSSDEFSSDDDSPVTPPSRVRVVVPPPIVRPQNRQEFIVTPRRLDFSQL